jgi:hypothetical protein
MIHRILYGILTITRVLALSTPANHFTERDGSLLCNNSYPYVDLQAAASFAGTFCEERPSPKPSQTQIVGDNVLHYVWTPDPAYPQPSTGICAQQCDDAMSNITTICKSFTGFNTYLLMLSNRQARFWVFIWWHLYLLRSLRSLYSPVVLSVRTTKIVLPFSTFHIDTLDLQIFYSVRINLYVLRN